jgi:hypothetical protein
MVVVLSVLINIAVFVDIENHIKRCFRSCRPINLAEDDDDYVVGDGNGNNGSHARVYLDKRTQLILLLAGVRGAVSFALVENIPVYDSVTKTGSKYKAELKAMTSSAIVFTLFVFGALTYITVKRGTDPQRHIAGSNLTHRLLSEPLDSEDGEDDENRSEMTNSLAFEIEEAGARPHQHHGGPPPPEEAIATPERYRLANEWTE